MAASFAEGVKIADDADIALVAVNLRDGPTGPAIADYLHAAGTIVIFVTANPELVAGNRSAIGFLSKPASYSDLKDALSYAADCKAGTIRPAPACLMPILR